MQTLDLDRATRSEPLTGYANVMDQMRKRGVVRSSNNSVADYCEALA
jgi:hypothetical protein